MIDLTTELVKEQDKWHRRYNDAEIENDCLKRENEQYKLAIHRLIMERDCAIRDINRNANFIYDDDPWYLQFERGGDCIANEIKTADGWKVIWRGVQNGSN